VYYNTRSLKEAKHTSYCWSRYMVIPQRTVWDEKRRNKLILKDVFASKEKSAKFLSSLPKIWNNRHHLICHLMILKRHDLIANELLPMYSAF
jgi:hypothetical protein